MLCVLARVCVLCLCMYLYANYIFFAGLAIGQIDSPRVATASEDSRRLNCIVPQASPLLSSKEKAAPVSGLCLLPTTRCQPRHGE